MTKIVRSKNVCGGKWRVAGTRLTVVHVLLELNSQGTIDKVVKSYPHLKPEDVLACVLWAALKIERMEASE